MATYVDESDLAPVYVDESDLVGGKPKAEKKNEPDPSWVWKLIGALSTGGSKAGAGLADLATSADLNFRKRFGLPTMGIEPKDVELSPKVDVLREAIVQRTMFPEKRNPAFWEDVHQNAAGSLMFPGGIARNIGASVSADAVQEILKDAGASKAVQIPAAILAALPWGIRSPASINRTPQKQAEKAIAPFTQGQLDEASRLQQEAMKPFRGKPVPLSAAQALNDKGRVLDLENFVVDSPFAPKSMLEDITAQPQRAKALAEQTRSFFGKADDSLLRGNQVESVIEEALQLPQKAAGRAAAPYYKLLETLRPDLSVADRFKLAAQLTDISDVKGILPKSEAGQAVNRIAGTVINPSMILNPKTQTPFQLANPDIRSLDNYLKQVQQQVSGTYGPFATSAEKVERAGLVPAAGAIKETLTEASPALRIGKQVYQDTLERLEPGVRATGLREAVARPAMEATAAKAPADWAKLENVLKRGNEKDVVRAFNIMATEQGGQAAFADITKNMLSRVFDKNFSSEAMKPSTAMSFAEELKKYPNIRKAVELTAAQQGAKDPIAAAEGFMRMLDIEQAAGRSRGIPGGATLAEIEKYATGKSGASLLFGHAIARSATIVRNVQYMINKFEMQRLSAALDDPNSIELLQQLAKEPLASRKADALYKALIGASTAENPEE
jgi:hypothetical protein